MAREDHHSREERRERERQRLTRRLRSWYGGDLGRLLLESERRELGVILPDLFGYYLVQVGSVMEEYLLGSSLIRRHVVIDGDSPGELSGDDCHRASPVFGHARVLPLQGDSVDVVLMPHTLEFEEDPHAALREVDRVLVSEGHVVILGFNPWSLWGLWRLFTWRRRLHPPWHGTYRSISRIKDWLALLGFDVIETRSCFFRPPIGHSGLLKRLRWMERVGWRWWPYRGGVYIIVAKKRVVTLTPLRPRGRRRRPLIQGDAVKPTT